MTTDFSDLEVGVPELDAEYWRQEAAHWRKKAARAELAYSNAYWDYESHRGMEEHCLFLAEALERG